MPWPTHRSISIGGTIGAFTFVTTAPHILRHNFLVAEYLRRLTIGFFGVRTGFSTSMNISTSKQRSQPHVTKH